MPLWNSIVDLLQPTQDHIKKGEILLAQYRNRGYLTLTSRQLLEIPDEVIAVFYQKLMDNKVPVSPVADHTDSGWLAKTSACFINIRATALSESECGNFIQAAKLLPGLRVKALHLAPFTDYEFGTVYAIRSLKTIAPQVVHQRLFQAGLKASLQLDAFIQAAHALNKAVGFDMEPHTAQFSIPVLEVPEAFRWIKLYPEDKNWLDYLLQNDQIYSREVQERLTSEVRALVAAFLKQKSLHSLDEEENDPVEVQQMKSSAYQEIVQVLIHQGYWTVPANSWDSDGLPKFAGYNFDENYPYFQYQNRDGKDSSAWAYHIVTPFAFYHNIALQGTVPRQKPEPNLAAVDLYCSAFLYWRDRFHFDFVRHDSVDHVFDSIFDSDGHWPLSDRPTPAVLAEFIRKSKLPGKPYIAHLAERMGDDCEDYQALGYDVLLGSDMMESVGQTHMEKTFRLQGRLEDLNTRRKSPFSVAYAVDTHDTGNPFLWGMSLTEKLGPEGMKIRLFLSRFGSWGLGRRPKYEVMGLSDLSTGLFQSSVAEKSLIWAGETDFTAFYHQLEDLYEALREEMSFGLTCAVYAGTDMSWWMISGRRHLMIFALWYDQIAAFSETGLEFSELQEAGKLPPGECPVPKRTILAKAGNRWNLKEIQCALNNPNLGVWLLTPKN